MTATHEEQPVLLLSSEEKKLDIEEEDSWKHYQLHLHHQQKNRRLKHHHHHKITEDERIQTLLDNEVNHRHYRVSHSNTKREKHLKQLLADPGIQDDTSQ